MRLKIIYTYIRSIRMLELWQFHTLRECKRRKTTSAKLTHRLFKKKLIYLRIPQNSVSSNGKALKQFHPLHTKLTIFNFNQCSSTVYENFGPSCSAGYSLNYHSQSLIRAGVKRKYRNLASENLSLLLLLLLRKKILFPLALIPASLMRSRPFAAGRTVMHARRFVGISVSLHIHLKS